MYQTSPCYICLFLHLVTHPVLPCIFYTLPLCEFCSPLLCGASGSDVFTVREGGWLVTAINPGRMGYYPLLPPTSTFPTQASLTAEEEVHVARLPSICSHVPGYQAWLCWSYPGTFPGTYSGTYPDSYPGTHSGTPRVYTLLSIPLESFPLTGSARFPRRSRPNQDRPSSIIGRTERRQQ